MTPEQWQQAKDLFCQALEIETTRRSAFLDKVCGDNEGLRAEVESLLAAVEHSRGVFETPAGEWFDFGSSDADAPEDSIRTLHRTDGNGLASAWIGRQIGRHRLVEIIGQGGMGTVFKAVRSDETFEQQAAVKIVNRETASRDILRRFRTERQILAKLDHPNIGKLLDGGATDDGLPYFVMEYIEGTPITDYCDEHRLSIAERLELFRTVCATVQYAHKNLIVHRDLKPSNILVTNDGTVKLLDFGIAKVLDRRKLAAQTIETTQLGMRVLTPKYAAPEQVRGESITTACDVYSLGVLLYELLSGYLPYRFKTYLPGEIEQVICEVEPDKPSLAVQRFEQKSEASGLEDESAELPSQTMADLRGTTVEKLHRQLAGDLDVIVLKALRKETERRFGSVEQFSEDIRRHLDGLPVAARPDTLRYRTVKYVKRNKLGLAAAVLVVASLVSGTVVSLWQAREARTERARAERRFNDVRKLTNSILFEFHDAIANLPGSTPARELLVKRALEYFDGLAKESQNNPSLLMELAIAYRKVGEVQGRSYLANLGDSEGALKSYRKSLDILESLHSMAPTDIDINRELSLTIENTGETLLRTGESDEALQYQQRTLGIREKLAVAAPNDQTFQKLLGDSYARVGGLLMTRGDYSGATRFFQLLIVNRTQLAKQSDTPGIRRSLATAYYRIGQLHRAVGCFIGEQIGNEEAARASHRKALDAYRLSLEILEKLFQGHTVSPDTLKSGDLADTCNSVALALARTGSPREALNYHFKALRIHESLSQADPKSLEYVRQTAFTNLLIGDLLFESGDFKQASDSYRKSWELYEKVTTIDPRNKQAQSELARLHDSLGILFLRLKKLNKAVHHHRQALALYETLCRDNPTNGRYFVEFRFAATHLGLSLSSTRQFAEARRILQNDLTAQKTRIERGKASLEETYAYSWLLLTCPVSELRNPAEALTQAERAVESSESKDAAALYVLASACLSANKPEAAETSLRKLFSLPFLLDLPENGPLVNILRAGLARHTSPGAVNHPFHLR